AASVAGPILARQTTLLLPGAGDHEIAPANLDPLRFGAAVEIVVADGVAVLKPVDALPARHVEQHAATGHLVAHMLDPELFGAARVDELGVVAVVHLVVQENVTERVPLR